MNRTLVVSQLSRVFVSHVATDEAWAQAISSRLGDAGYAVTLPRDAVPKDGTLAAIGAAVSSADFVVVLVSARSSASRWVRAEVASATAAGKSVFPVLVDETAVVPAALAQLAFVDATQTSLEETTNRLVDAISGVSPRSPWSDSLPPSPTGLWAWVARTEELSAIDQAFDSSPLRGPRTVVLVGAAGVGKTVLARQFIETHRHEYGSIQWTTAGQLAASTQNPHHGDTKARTLLVIDDVDDYHDIANALDGGNRDDVLLISRTSAWGPPFGVVRVGPFTQTQAEEFLRHRLPSLSIEDAASLAVAVRGLPLALTVAAHAAERQPVEGVLEQLTGLSKTVTASETEDGGFYYLDTDDPNAISEFERAFADAVSSERDITFDPPQRGSWRRRWSARYNPDRVEALIDKAERAAEVAAIAKPEGQANRDNAEAIARLLESSIAIPNMVISSGSVLFIKITDASGARVFSKTLSASELRRFEENQHELSKPSDALAFLDLLRTDPHELGEP